MIITNGKFITGARKSKTSGYSSVGGLVMEERGLGVSPCALGPGISASLGRALEMQQMIICLLSQCSECTAKFEKHWAAAYPSEWRVHRELTVQWENEYVSNHEMNWMYLFIFKSCLVKVGWGGQTTPVFFNVYINIPPSLLSWFLWAH